MLLRVARGVSVRTGKDGKVLGVDWGAMRTSQKSEAEEEAWIIEDAFRTRELGSEWTNALSTKFASARVSHGVFTSRAPRSMARSTIAVSRSKTVAPCSRICASTTW